MAIAPKLQMRQGQSLVMTPQLQQAIKLLQLSNLELAEYVETEIERNPLLERGEAEAPERSEPQDDRAGADLDLGAGNKGGEEAQSNLDAPSEDAYASDSASDMAGVDVAAAGSGPSASLDWSGASSGRGSGEDFDFESILSAEITLREHLERQLSASGLRGADYVVALRLIDETDEGGYMRGFLPEIATQLGVSEAHVARVLAVCHGFEPAGVMARNVAECLALQLKELDRYDPAMQALVENLDLVARRDLKALASLCGVDLEDIGDMLLELRSLTPKPGSAFAFDAAPAVIPDVFVRETPNGMYAVELNADTLPKVLLNRTYYAEVSRLSRTEDERNFVSECQASANWLIKSLDQRARTILRVSQEIVRQQDGFFARGVEGLRPLNLKTVADAVEMHESTVSRVTSGKYMSTPRGVFELKFFFSASIPSLGGGEAHSAEAVRHRIKHLIEAEDATAVLSDDQIVERLRGFGVDIARRTVAKYRESLKIPSSVERRRMLAQSA